MTSSTPARISDISVQASWRPPVPAKMPRWRRSSGAASAKSIRRRYATPRPFSSATAGSSTGSAYGARNRTTKCSARKSSVSRAVGTQNRGVTVLRTLASTVAAYTATSTIAKSSIASSALRCVRGAGTRGCSPVLAGGGAGTAGAVTSDPFGRGPRAVGGPATDGADDRREGFGGCGRGVRGGGRRGAGDTPRTGRRRDRRARLGGGSGDPRAGGRRAERLEVRVVRVGAGQLSQGALGLGAVVDLDALPHLALRDRGQVVHPAGHAVTLHGGQVDAGDL